MRKLTLENSRLKRAHEWSRRQLVQFQDLRTQRWLMAAGAHYSDKGADGPAVPLPLMAMALNIYSQALVSKNPAALCLPQDPQKKREAKLFEVDLNRQFEEMELAVQLERCVREALISVGILLVGLAQTDQIKVGKKKYVVGKPFVANVGLDDFVIDMGCKCFDQAYFMGHRYRLPIQAIKESGQYKNVEDLQETIWRGGNEQGNDKVAQMTRDGEMVEQPLYPLTDLWDIYCPYTGVIQTWRCDENGYMIGDEPIWERDYTGPKFGPYLILGLGEVPDNPMPLPPAALWQDPIQLMNDVQNKIGNQARRQKDILGVPQNSYDDAQAAVRTEDGDVIKLDNPQGLVKTPLWGVNRELLAYGLTLDGMVNKVLGNLNLLGGLGAESPTATQDEMLSGSANKTLESMQRTVYGWTQRVMQAIGYYHFYDPLRKNPIQIKIPGTSVEWTEESAYDPDANFDEYDIKIVPYSMQDKSPQQRLQFMFMVLDKMAPYAGLAAQQGKLPNIPAILEDAARYGGVKETTGWWTTGEPVGSATDSENNTTPGQLPMAQSSTRKYVRENRSAATGSGTNMQIAQMLSGGQSQ